MRLIDADALIERLTQVQNELWDRLTDADKMTIPTMDDIRYRVAEEAEDLVNNAPTIDARPVVHGKWTLNRDGSGKCSECGYVQPGCWDMDNWDNFCHHCGADMR